MLFIKGNMKLYKRFELLWKEKALNELGQQYWTEVHESNFMNYLTAKIRFLTHKHKTLTKETFGKMSTKQLDCFGFGHMIDKKFPENRTSIIPIFDEWAGIQCIWKINGYEARRGNSKSIPLVRGIRFSLSEIQERLASYYSDVIKARQEAIEVRNELVRIGEYIASYLSSILDKDSRYSYYISKEIIISGLFINNDKKKSIVYGQKLDKEIKKTLIRFGIPPFCLSILYNDKQFDNIDYKSFSSFVKAEFT
jgi:hypothetical protein